MGTRQFYFIAVTCTLLIKSISSEYTNEFAIHVEPHVNVDELASKYGLVNKGQVRKMSTFFLTIISLLCCIHFIC